MSQPTDPLQVAQRESRRLERLGQQRMTKQMLTGGVAGIALSVLIVYSVGPSPKLPAFLIGLVPAVLLFVIVTAVMRRRLGITPLWSLSVEERRLVRSSLRHRERLTDPRLAAAAIEHIRVAERSFRLVVLAFILIVAGQAMDWAQARRRHASLIFTVMELAGLLIIFGPTTANYMRARRAKSAYRSGDQ